MTKKPTCCVLDVDGVIIRGRAPDHLSWTIDLQKDLGVEPHLLEEHFFKFYFTKVLKGETKLDAALQRAMEEIGQPDKTERLIKYWLENDNGIDTELLGYLDKFRRNEDVHLSLATNQEHRRAAYIWDQLKLKDHFDRLIYSAEIGHIKSEDAFFRNLNDIFRPDEYAHRYYIDDDASNISLAKKHGWNCHLFQGTDELVGWLGQRLAA